jgi:hypothetical protein
MNFDTFTRILTTFADNSDSVENARGELIVQIHDDVIHATTQSRGGNIYVNENGVEMSGDQWIIERIARLPLLADRILSLIPAETHFVMPSGDLLPELSEAKSDDRVHVDNVVDSVISMLDRRPAGTSSVLYLTSDAGEGKTTLINQIARMQATAYKEKRSDWMLIPITLGGKPFLRFDDLIVGTLMNRLRFPFFYHNSFIELVRLGVLVPAFDGFEEMFVESSSGEALSALGNLVQSLDSAGSLLISARKAYFEYKSFANQARLFDTINTDNAVFSSMAIKRWSKDQFLKYCEIREIPDGGTIYESVAGRFNATHPLLTRAVLVKRLIDVASGTAERDALLFKLGQSPHDYFFEFVNAIIEREASEKWIDRSGEPAKPLISVAEHHELLAFIAQEMWLANSSEISDDSLDLIVELNSESRKKDPKITRQIKERIRQHALLISANPSGRTYAFDHEEFRDFFLGQAIARRLQEGAESDLRSILREAPLPKQAFGAALHSLTRSKFDLDKAIKLLQKFGEGDLISSFTRENCGGLIIRILDRHVVKNIMISNLTFPVDALANRTLANIRFSNCYFQSSELDSFKIENCAFEKCRFDRLDLTSSMSVINTTITDCEFVNVVPVGNDAVYAPDLINSHLVAAGFTQEGNTEVQDRAVSASPDENMVLVDKMLRCFLRSTAVSDGVLKLRLGIKANSFIKDIIPQLLRAGVVANPESGPDRDAHYRLKVPMREVDAAIANAKGSFESFLRNFDPPPNN